MRNRNFRFITLGLVVVLALSALGLSVFAQESEPTRAETVIFDIDGTTLITNTTNFNWLIPGAAGRNTGIHQAVFEPLFILNYETGEIDPWLGVSFEPNESLDVWTLTLRDGIKWQDGEAFNADDVVFTIELLKANVPDLGGSPEMDQWVESVEKVDDLTVVFNLTAPNPRFQLDYWSVRIWGGIMILPEHVWADVDPLTFTFYDPEQGWPMGTGPYRLVASSENEMVYDRVENWWGAEVGFQDMPAPRRLRWVVTGNDEIRGALAVDNQLDSVMDITLGTFEAILARNPNFIGWTDGLPYTWPDPCPRQLGLNNTVAPWDDPNMRKALSLIMDRNQIVAISYEGTTIPSRSVFVEYGGLFPIIDAMEERGLTLSPSADVAAGQALIEGAGYELNANGFYERDGVELSLNMQVADGFIEKIRIADVLVEQFRAAGIFANRQSVAEGTWNENRNVGNFEAQLDWDACGSINEPWNSMDTFNTRHLLPVGERANRNKWRWSGEGAERYSELVEQIGVLPLGDPQILDLAVEAMTIWVDEMPVVPITQAKKLVPFNTTYWTGWPTAENNYNHPATWWHSTHQIIHNLQPTGAN